jgi:5-methylcytosine-specific restriction enzyme subunit McrC
MGSITVYEFDMLCPANAGIDDSQDLRVVPERVFNWLESQCLLASEQNGSPWLKLTQRRGRRAVRVTNFVGVLSAPYGFQVEVLPKVGKAIGGGVIEARQLLIDMLASLHGFRHLQIGRAKVAAYRMPLLEVFLGECLRSIEQIVKRGLRGAYSRFSGNHFALRGKMLVAEHLRHNLCRADRFFVEYDEFSTDRAENRLLHAVLLRALRLSSSQENQRLARELCFAFAEIPASSKVEEDFQLVQVDRGMGYYSDALDWARLFLRDRVPLTGSGKNSAPSLLFPMEAVYEAFVAKHLVKQLASSATLKAQSSSQYLVRHIGMNWFRLKPDLLVRKNGQDVVVLDTKWKLIDERIANGAAKYGLSQSDFYQLQAYGLSYLDGRGDVVLVYPKTDHFAEPLPVFEFPKANGLRLWVLPFCLKSRKLHLPPGSFFAECLTSSPS